ncbi:MAG: glycosyltransferase family 39 protein [bacterium]
MTTPAPSSEESREPVATTGSHTAPKGGTQRLLAAGGVLAVLVVLVGILLRASYIGHQLLWDEAMALCTARSFVSGGRDFFSYWFWRHPPLYSLLTFALLPTSPGFAERVEWLSVALGCLNLLLLYRVNAQLLGVAPAWWSLVLLATMPGSVFFDTWIKTDHLVSTFGLLAILALHRQRIAYAGLSLGLALLSKETAVFYYLTALLALAAGSYGQRGWLRRLALLAVLPIAAASWWYLLFAGRLEGATGFSLAGVIEHTRFAGGAESHWAAPWTYYLRQWPVLLGWHGLLLVLIGIPVAATAFWSGSLRNAGQDASAHDTRSRRALAAWPIVLVLVSFASLSFIPSKVSWIVICTLPAFATLQAGGLCALWRGVSARLETRTGAGILLSACLALALTGAAWLARDYDRMLLKLVPEQQHGAVMSRRIAETMNGLVNPGDSVLITSFHYWTGLPPGQPCAVFTYYFSKSRDVDVLIRPHTARGQDLADDVIRYEIDWAILSPPQGDPERDVFGCFAGTYGLLPIQLDGAWIFDTRSLRRGAAMP